MNRNETIALGAGAASLAGLLFLGVRRAKAKAIVADLNKVLVSNPTGNSTDIQTSKAFHPEYWKHAIQGGAKWKIYTVAQAREMAKAIKNAVGQYGGTYDDEKEIVKQIAKMPSKAQISMVSFYFRDAYGSNLGSFIVQYVDKDNNLAQIQQHINSIPDYIKAT